MTASGKQKSIDVMEALEGEIPAHTIEERLFDIEELCNCREAARRSPS